MHVVFMHGVSVCARCTDILALNKCPVVAIDDVCATVCATYSSQ